MKLLYLHYYILDFSDIRKPRIMSHPFTHKHKAIEICKAYYKPGEYRIRMGYQIQKRDDFKNGQLAIYHEVNYRLRPNNIVDRKHYRRTRKQLETRLKRKNNTKLEEKRWLLRCIENNIPKFMRRFEKSFTTDIPELLKYQGTVNLIENLQGHPGPEDWNKLHLVDYLYSLNILRVLIIYDYDNGPFYRYKIAQNLWKTFYQDFLRSVKWDEGYNLINK